MEKESIIKKMAADFGADVCGIGSIERFKDSPEGFSPIDIWNKTVSVIAVGIALPKGIFEVQPRLIYGHYNLLCKNKVDDILFKLSTSVEKEFACRAVPLPADGPYEYWEKENLTGHGLVSMKHAAVNCGLGSIGKSTLLLNEQFGNRLNIGIVLTDLALKSDDFVKEVCIPNCRKCIESCPAHAISENGVNQKLCRLNTYGKNERGFETVDCNQCRSACPRALGK